MSFAESQTTREARPDVKSVAAKTLIEANKLEYKVPPSLSVVVQRRHIRNEAQSLEYVSGRTCNIMINSGDDYANGQTSYLVFKAESTDGDAVTWGSGSALNMIRTITFFHSSGVEIERLENLNLYSRFVHKNTKGEEWFKTVGSMMGYEYAGSKSYEDLKTAQHTFVIPMSEISGMFNTEQLIPSYLLSGMRVSIDLAEAKVATKGTTASSQIKITEAAIVLDAFTLADNIQDKLNQVSGTSKNGTEFHWQSYDHSPKTITQASLHISAEKAVSRASRAFALTRSTEYTNDGLKDSLKPEDLKLSQYQFRLGAMFFPNKTLTDSVEFYHNQTFAFGGFGHQMATIDYKAFEGKAGDGGAAGDSESAAVAALERSDMTLSGLPVSGSRALTLDATYSNSGDRTVDMFLEYTKVASCFLYDRCVVKE
jgi:hypothetical protein